MKRRRCHTKILSTDQCRSQSNNGQLIQPVKGFSKPEIQELIRQKIVVILKQSDRKMDELIGRIQKIECSYSYEAQIGKLQAAIGKIKRMQQAASACMRNLQPSRSRTSAAECCEQSLHGNTGSPDPTEVQTGSVPAVTKTTENPKAASSTSETVLTVQDMQETQKDNNSEEVVFCGVLSPDDSIIQRFPQKQVKANLVVDLTTEGNAEDTRDREKGIILSVPERMVQPVQAHEVSRQSTCCHANTTSEQMPKQTNSQTAAQGEQILPLHLDLSDTRPQSPQSQVQNDWQSKLPPLPINPFPATLPHTAAMSNLPQRLHVRLARIQRPRGIGVLWTVDEVDPSVASLDSYSLYFTQEDSFGCFPEWKNIGVLKAMPLPMACSITAFAQGHRICVSIVAKDVYGRYGPYSKIQTIFPRATENLKL